MEITNPFQAKYAAAKLAEARSIDRLERLVPVFLRTGLEIYPHQIVAAANALSNPLGRGSF